MKPMLAATLDNMANAQFPVNVSPKLDGIRVLVHPELGPVTRSLKPVPNPYMRKFLEPFTYLDGELIIGGLDTPELFNSTQSIVMSKSAHPGPFTFVVFDSFQTPTNTYERRMNQAHNIILTGVKDSRYHTITGTVNMIPNRTVTNMLDLLDYEGDALDKGYEGIMLRDVSRPYKYGRSTIKEFGLVKMKQYSDAEAEIIDVEFLQHNANTATTNALGRTERSSHKAGKVEDDTRVGALVVRGINGAYAGAEFKIGTGFTDEQRKDLSFDAYMGGLKGKIVRYTYQAEGSKDAPRFPRFSGFRDPADMSN